MNGLVGTRIRLLAAAVAAAVLLASCSSAGGAGTADGLEGTVIISHAGSLTVPVGELTDAFGEQHRRCFLPPFPAIGTYSQTE